MAASLLSLFPTYMTKRSPPEIWDVVVRLQLSVFTVQIGWNGASQISGGDSFTTTGGLAPKARKRTLFDSSLHPSFVTKSVRLNRTELSMSAFWRIPRDLAPTKGLSVSFYKNKRKKFVFHTFSRFLKNGTFFCHQVGEIKSLRADFFFPGRKSRDLTL